MDGLVESTECRSVAFSKRLVFPFNPLSTADVEALLVAFGVAGDRRVPRQEESVWKMERTQRKEKNMREGKGAQTRT